MILNTYIAPGQGQITSDDKISMLIKSFCYFDHLVKFHYDTPNSKGTRGQKPFLTVDKCHNTVINYRNLPINISKRDILGTNAYAKFE